MTDLLTYTAVALLAALLVLGALEVAGIIDDDSPKWLQVLGKVAGLLSALPAAYLLATRLGEGGRVIDQSTAGEDAQDQLDQIDEETRHAIDDPDDTVSADDAESRLHDAADELGVEPPDDAGFSGDPIEVGPDGLIDVDFDE